MVEFRNTFASWTRPGKPVLVLVNADTLKNDRMDFFSVESLGGSILMCVPSIAPMMPGKRAAFISLNSAEISSYSVTSGHAINFQTKFCWSPQSIITDLYLRKVNSVTSN